MQLLIAAGLLLTPAAEPAPCSAPTSQVRATRSNLDAVMSHALHQARLAQNRNLATNQVEEIRRCARKVFLAELRDSSGIVPPQEVLSQLAAGVEWAVADGIQRVLVNDSVAAQLFEQAVRDHLLGKFRAEVKRLERRIDQHLPRVEEYWLSPDLQHYMRRGGRSRSEVLSLWKDDPTVNRIAWEMYRHGKIGIDVPRPRLAFSRVKIESSRGGYLWLDVDGQQAVFLDGRRVGALVYKSDRWVVSTGQQWKPVLATR